MMIKDGCQHCREIYQRDEQLLEGGATQKYFTLRVHTFYFFNLGSPFLDFLNPPLTVYIM